MTWDAATGQVLLFGGYDGSSNYFADTWAWNGTTWTQLAPANFPPARDMASMVYDPATGNVVLFGGYGPDGSASGFFADTWTWDGANWTQSSATGPSARQGASVDYDANSAAVLLFGGLDSTNTYQQDTWLWNGTTWTQQPTTAQPDPRSLAGVAYDTATSQTVLFGGTNASNSFNDTWTWNGSAWTLQSPASYPSARTSPAMAWNSLTSQFVLFGGRGFSDTWTWDGVNWTASSTPDPAVNIADAPVAAYNTASGQLDLVQPALTGSTDGTWQIGPLALGSANVCLGGATTPAPCTQSATLTFAIAAGTTVGSVNVATQGASGLDFTAPSPDASATLCSAQTYTSATLCTVDVTFAPQYSGLRTGAVTLTDGSGNPLATVYLSGAGLASQVVFAPGAPSVVANGFDNPVGVVTDSKGDVFVADYVGNRVVEVPWTGAAFGPAVSIGTGLAGPSGVAVDGSGNLFIADFDDGRIIEVPWTGNAFGTQMNIGSGWSAPAGVSVDLYGDLFVADYNANDVVELPWTGAGYGAPTTVGTGLTNPVEVVVDANRNAFIADGGNDRVVEVPWTSTGFGPQTTIGAGLSGPDGVAVDANGNVFIADSGNNRVVEVPWTGSAFGPQVTVLDTGLQYVAEVAVDSRGNVFITDTNHYRVLELDLADAPSFSFATATASGTADVTDPAQTATLTNIGNQPLVFATGSNPSYSAAFPVNSSDASLCASGSVLAVQSSCDVSASFAPIASGTNSGGVTLTDNALNVSNGTQSVAYTGTGTQGASVITWPSFGPLVYGTAISAAQENATANVPGAFAYSNAIGWKPKVGSHTITVTFTPADPVSFTPSTATLTFSVTQATPVLSWGPLAPITYGTPLGAQLHARASVAGTFVYSPSADTVLPAGPQTLSVSFTPTDTADYAATSTTVPLSVNKARPVITWATPDPITYPATVSATQENATASVSGSFRYSEPIGWMPRAGTHPLAAYFTPDDTSDYYPTTAATVSLVVNQAIPTVTWAAPAAIKYGTPLGAGQLKAKASVPGTFLYDPASGTVLTAGAQTLGVTFTPTDATDYAPVTTSVPLTVNQVKPVLTWPTPDPITYGTAVSATQEDATANVPGTYTYSQPIGWKPIAGTHSLTVHFTPSDATDYTTAAATVTLTVN
jgi:sugar lactone lactonase YvrE